MAVGYLQNKNNSTVIESVYNMFSRYRWQTYIFDRSQTIFTAAAAGSMSTAAARAPAEGHAGAIAGAPHSWGGVDRDEGGGRGREDRGGWGRRNRGGGGLGL